jgi:hypothetical protein
MVTLAAALSLHLMHLPVSDGSQPNEAPSFNVQLYIPDYAIMLIKPFPGCSRKWSAVHQVDHRKNT